MQSVNFIIALLLAIIGFLTYSVATQKYCPPSPTCSPNIEHFSIDYHIDQFRDIIDSPESLGIIFHIDSTNMNSYIKRKIMVEASRTGHEASRRGSGFEFIKAEPLTSITHLGEGTEESFSRNGIEAFIITRSQLRTLDNIIQNISILNGYETDSLVTITSSIANINSLNSNYAGVSATIKIPESLNSTVIAPSERSPNPSESIPVFSIALPCPPDWFRGYTGLIEEVSDYTYDLHRRNNQIEAGDTYPVLHLDSMDTEYFKYSFEGKFNALSFLKKQEKFFKDLF